MYIPEGNAADLTTLEYCVVFFTILKLFYIVFFFFQAEDGIRDGHVTGVQTCALPILGFHDAMAKNREMLTQNIEP